MSSRIIGTGLNVSDLERSVDFYTRLLGFKPLRSDDYEEFYREYVPRWSIQRNFRVCDKSMISLSYLGSYHFTDEDPPLIFGTLTSSRSDRSERP